MEYEGKEVILVPDDLLIDGFYCKRCIFTDICSTSDQWEIDNGLDECVNTGGHYEFKPLKE